MLIFFWKVEVILNGDKPILSHTFYYLILTEKGLFIFDIWSFEAGKSPKLGWLLWELREDYCLEDFLCIFN
jgi:hypothetical protein